MITTPRSAQVGFLYSVRVMSLFIFLNGLQKGICMRWTCHPFLSRSSHLISVSASAHIRWRLNYSFRLLLLSSVVFFFHLKRSLNRKSHWFIFWKLQWIRWILTDKFSHAPLDEASWLPPWIDTFRAVAVTTSRVFKYLNLGWTDRKSGSWISTILNLKTCAKISKFGWTG
jgi:hypothetical protein